MQNWAVEQGEGFADSALYNGYEMVQLFALHEAAL